jgi:hypothetical protein
MPARPHIHWFDDASLRGRQPPLDDLDDGDPVGTR